jgi:hypothetical protein
MTKQHLFSPDTSNRHETGSSAPRWSPPPKGTVYVNVDAALFTSSRQMGIGVVIRSHTSECLIACSELLMEVTTPELAEALALRRVVSLAGDEGFDKLMVISYCLSLI